MAKKNSPDFLNFFQNHPFPSWICDEKTLRLIDMNAAAIKALGFSPAEWKKMTTADIFNRELRVDVNSSESSYDNVLINTRNNGKLMANVSLTAFSQAGDRYLLTVLNQQRNSEIELLTAIGREELLRQFAPILKEIVQFSRTEAGEVDLKTLNITLSPELLKILDIELDAPIVMHHPDKTDIEERLKQSVKEKEMLIKEIHHRVKNNLQIISSIIYLKMISLEQSDIRSFLESTRQKIKSIALIHERLLQSEKLDEIEIADYLGKLLIDIQVSHYRDDLALVIEQDVEQGLMPLDTAIYCGLIINELLTNSIKHAFHNRRHGIISVSLNKNENKYILQVRDNGVTIPEHIIPGKANSFGLQMLDVFVKQLNGSWRIIRDNGTTFFIRF